MLCCAFLRDYQQNLEICLCCHCCCSEGGAAGSMLVAGRSPEGGGCAGYRDALLHHLSLRVAFGLPGTVFA